MKQVRVVGTFEVQTIYDGIDGSNGARMRMGVWQSGKEYLSGTPGEEWYDVVEFEKLLYLCVKSKPPIGVTPKDDVANHGGYWSVAQGDWDFIATKLLLSERIKSDMIDTDDLVAKRILTSSVGESAHMEIVGSEMKVFGNSAMNIRFGVNEDGYAVLEYYDNDGRKLYDLGPGGITDIPISEESWTTGFYQRLGDTVREVLQLKGYKTKLYNAAYKVYQYHSKMVSGVLDDPDNDGKWFVKQGTSLGNVLPDGIYRHMPSSSAGNGAFVQYVTEDTGRVLTRDDLKDLSDYNEPVYDQAPLYSEILYSVVSGRMSHSGTIAYWNRDYDVI